MIPANGGPARHAGVVARAIIAQAMCLMAGVFIATDQPANNVAERLQEAREHYKHARFGMAVTLLTQLADDNSLGRDDRREVLYNLGRAYFAKNQNDKAEWALSKLLELEPPAVSIDADAHCDKFMHLFYRAQKKKTGSDSLRTDPGIKTIAILDFKNRSVSEDAERFNPMEKGFPELLISQLKGVISLRVVERERIQWLLDEIGMENDPGKFDVGTAVRVGKLLGAQSVLFGSFIKFKGKMTLLARLVKTETGEIIATEQMNGDADEFFDLAEKLSVKLTKKIDVAVSEAEIKKGTPTKSLDAMMAYSEGVALSAQGNYVKAIEKFQEALNLDPTYEKAKVKIEALKPLIG